MASLRFDENIGLDGFDKTNGKLTGMIKQYIPIGKKSSLSFTAKGGGAIHGDIPEVMAYHSAPVWKGGAGALYVILKKSDKASIINREIYQKR